MIVTWTAMRRLVAALALAGTGMAALPQVALAQDEARLRKIEAEVRALQRAVFPGGDGRFFTPEVERQPAATPTPGGTPASSALGDVLVRLDALEAQVRQLTAQTEENTNTLAQLVARFDALEARQQTAAPAAGVATASGPAPAASGGAPAASPAAAASAPAATGPSAERLAAVQAIAKPDTGDAGADEYTYGFRLWDAKFYPEAQQQLRLYVDRHPNHAQISFGRNLLGRAYLDDGQPREAATWFLQNYQADKQAARAGDSLLFLAEAMIALEDTRRACIALAEFADTYPALASGRLLNQYEATRQRVSCN